MEDDLFTIRINEIARTNHLKLPALKRGELPSSEFLERWAKFLEECVKKGIALSDDRWQRVTVKSRLPHTSFALEDGSGEQADGDFRVGLQLLMGLLEEQNGSSG